MKTKSILFTTAILIFSLLFYKQTVGLNYLLFSILLITFSLVMHRKAWKSSQWVTIASGTLISGFFCFYNASAFAITMSIVSVLILGFVNRWKKISVLTALLAGIGSQIISVALIIKGRILRNKLRKLQEIKMMEKSGKWLPIVIVIAVVLIFASLYSSINPVFEKFTSDIFKYISPGWFFFCILGFILLYSFFYPTRIVRIFTSIENKNSKPILLENLNPENSFLGNKINISNEIFTAKMLFIILNCLLLFLNISDVNYLLLKGSLPYDITLSDYVHKGVGAVIVSIIFAISLIIFFFRGKLNFDSSSKTIKILTYIWIFQNIVLIGMTIYKNQLYIESYALTYKRIGVYFYLFFSLIGLALTAYKVFTRQSTWFLFRSNAFAFYVILILACTLNWNSIVTNYNLKHKNDKDIDYLLNLEYENLPLLWKIEAFNKSYYDYYEIKNETNQKIHNLPYPIINFLTDYENHDIQSYSVKKQEVYDFFMNEIKSGKVTEIQNNTENIQPN